MNRKAFLKTAGLGTGALALSPVFISCSGKEIITEDPFTFQLPIPEEFSSGNALLKASPKNFEIGDRITLDGFSFNNHLPGPTIRKKRGESVNIRFQNELRQDSIIHWHGLIVPPEMDGHPKDAIEEGVYEYKYAINQRAGTYWYHPHPHRITGEQVYKGLAGFFIVEDEEEKALNLPSGHREIPLVIQDRRINNKGEIVYNPTMPEQMMTGFMGGHIFVNGVPAPYHTVNRGYYRFRILNGSNTRIYNLAFENDAPFTVIGSDGGLLPEAIQTNELLLGPGERADLLVDFSSGFSNNRVKLVSKPFDISSGGMMRGMQNMMGSDFEQGEGFTIMEFRINKSEADFSFSLPDSLSNSVFPDAADASKTRPIKLSMEMMNGHTINGKLFEMNRVDINVNRGDTEIWEFINDTNVPHPMHIHAVQFKVLERSGNRGLLPTETGWKDTVLVMPGERVKVIMKFDALVGLYVFHCHNLEHEDNGMMANVKIN